ncbi:hypothetical protein FDV58_33770 [Bradyrhizobium elkanii]|uniref:Uncharacterized protein n=1 Tax=Bradyrhizobium elkanii TaxID=29448 RepID=A0A4U6RI84_BRAEL|nr:hypothetical protein FDV58_33770 [Bradyrhizobium elkanii]
MPVQPIYRVYDEAVQITRQTALVRQIVARSVVLLNLSVPDTFLGRRTQESFPQEESRYGEDRGLAT